MLQDDAPWYERPLLIWGMQKTGTTLLMDLLDGHPHILVYPNELKIKLFFRRRYRTREQLIADYKLKNPDPLKTFSGYKGDRWALSNAPLPLDEVPQNLRGLNEYRGRIVGLSEEETQQLFDFERYYEALDSNLAVGFWSAKDLLISEIKAFAAGARINSNNLKMWALKEVGGVDVIDLFLSHFLLGKVVCIVRDPRGAYASRIRDWKRRQVNYTFRDQACYLMDYNDSYYKIAHAVAEYGPERMWLVRYEDLVRDTENMMKKLADFCGQPYHPILKQPTKLGRPSVVATSSLPGVKEVFVTSLKRWRTELSAREIALVEAITPALFNISIFGYRRISVGVIGRTMGTVQGMFFKMYRNASKLVRKNKLFI